MMAFMCFKRNSLTVSGAFMENMEFKQASLDVSFLNRTIELDPVIPSKGIACAMECSDDPKCLAYDFDQVSKCTLMTQVGKFSSGTTHEVFIRSKENLFIFWRLLSRI